MREPSEPLLTENERTILDERTDLFVAALKQGGIFDWSPFYSDLAEPLRTRTLTEIAVIDLEKQWKIGKRPHVEDYLRRYPELGTLDSVSIKLIVEEYHRRKETGEVIDEDDVMYRFPKRGSQIVALLGRTTETQVSKALPFASKTPHKSGKSSSEISIAQQYDLVETLGKGMFGEVWLARKLPSGIEKAVKIVTKPADREEAQRELRAVELIKNLRHPYLLATEDFWVSENRLHIVMELADGTLRSLLKKYQQKGETGIPVQELLGYIREAAEGLDYLHTKKVTHRDVKPDNILILNGHAKIADFGLAREQELVMASMSFAGTPAYMAPEIWGGSGGPASDQYSLAFVYVELRQGRAPLKPAPMADMMFAHLEGHFDFAENIPEPERAVLRTAMHKSPEERFPTCTAFTEALAEALGYQVYRKSGHGSSVAFPSLAEATANPGTHTISPTDSGHDTILPSSRKPAPPTKPKRETSGPSSTPSVVMKGLPRRKPPTFKPVIAAIALLGLLLAASLLIYFAVSGKTKEPVVETTQPQGLIGIPTVQDPPKVTPGNSEPVLPANAKAAPQAKVIDLADGRRMYDAIVIPVGTESVRFRLFAPSGSISIKPFYMMECKVWVKLYQDAAKEQTQPDEPAMGMTALQAQAFAEKAFGGSLPTPKEWDIAAGYYSQDGRTGPNMPGAQIFINRKVPEVVNRDLADGKDVTPQGLRDMAGNGREFTNAILNTPNGELNSDNVKDDTLVVLRGRSYTLATPLDYAILKTQQEQPQTQFANVGSRYTGFRVVIRMP